MRCRPRAAWRPAEPVRRRQGDHGACDDAGDDDVEAEAEACNADARDHDDDHDHDTVDDHGGSSNGSSGKGSSGKGGGSDDSSHGGKHGNDD